MSALTSVRMNPYASALRATLKSAWPNLTWRHHGIGVLQAYLLEDTEPEIRAHVWDRRLIKPGMEMNGDIHDHRFEMVSHVLAGMICHEEWITTPDVKGRYTTMALTHARAAADTKFHGPVTPLEDRLDAAVETYWITAGHTYTFAAGVFHRSAVLAETAVTLVEKHNQKKIPARILHRIDREPVMAFGHDMDHELVAKILAEARALL
jgi:hypothetical protein